MDQSYHDSSQQQRLSQRVPVMQAGYQPFAGNNQIELPRKQRIHKHGRRRRGQRVRNNISTNNVVTVMQTDELPSAYRAFQTDEVESRRGHEYPRTPSPPPLLMHQTQQLQPDNNVYTTTSTYVAAVPQVSTYQPLSTTYRQHQPVAYGPKSASHQKEAEKVRTTVGEPAPPSRYFGANSRFVHTIKNLPCGWTKHSIVTTGTEPETGLVTTVKQNIVTNEDHHRRKYLRDERGKPDGVYEEYPRYKWYCRPRPANTSAYAWMLVIAGLFNLACGFFMIILAYNAQGDSGTILLWKILGPIGMATGLLFLLVGLYLLYYYYRYDIKGKQARQVRMDAAAARKQNENHPYQQQSGSAYYAPTAITPYSTIRSNAVRPDLQTGTLPHHYEHLHGIPPTIISANQQPLQQSILKSPRTNDGLYKDNAAPVYAQSTGRHRIS